MTAVKLTPRQMIAQARVDEMLDTARRVKGFGFAEVANAVLQSRRAMMIYDFTGGKVATYEDRKHMAKSLMAAVAGVARLYSLGPGQFAEAIRHGRVMFRESIRESLHG